MAKVTRVSASTSTNDGAWVASLDRLEELSSSAGKASDVLRATITEQKGTIEAQADELEKTKTDAANELARTKETLTRERDEWKAKSIAADEKIRRAFGNLQ